MKSRNHDDIEKIFVLTKEAISKCSLEEFFNQKQATDKFIIGNLICAEPIVYAIRKELKQIFPEVKVQLEEIKKVLLDEVIKRELLEGDDSENAQKKITKAYRRKEKLEKTATSSSEETPIKTDVSHIGDSNTNPL